MNQELINKIRENSDIIDVISKYIPLVKKGKNYFGICPFHNDTNPSLSVSKDKQIYKCFVCGEAGNVFNFVSKYENVSFMEAVKILGDNAGISVDLKDNKIDKNQDYYDMYDITSKYFQNNLFSNLGEKARNYLENRKLDIETIKEFQIGLSLNSPDGLYKLLSKKCFNDKFTNSGLISGDHDVYINRIIFPLFDVNGKINGFSGRIYNGENTNKYLNTTETPIFKKGENLYNYYRAKEYVRKEKYVIIMEGFMAVIRAHTIGIDNCIATMGTSLTNDQINLIKKLTNNVYLCFDGDNAGINATINNGKILDDLGFNVKIISLSDNLDPDDYIIKYGSESFKVLIDSPINYNDFKINKLKQGINFNSSNDLSKYINLVLPEISLEKDEIKREIMLKKLANETNVWYTTLEKKLNELLSKKENIQSSNIVVKREAKKDKYIKALETIIYYMLVNKKNIALVMNSNVYIPVEEYRMLAFEINDFYDKFGYINFADFYASINDSRLQTILKDVMLLDLDDDVSNSVILDYLKVIKNYNVALEISKLEKLIINEVNPLKQAELSNKIRNLKMEMGKNG